MYIRYIYIYTHVYIYIYIQIWRNIQRCLYVHIYKCIYFQRNAPNCSCSGEVGEPREAANEANEEEATSWGGDRSLGRFMVNKW